MVSINQMQENSENYPSLRKKFLSALLYGFASFMITVVNKTVLTTYGFPSFQVVGLGQITASILVLYIGKKLKLVRFPDLERSTFKKIWPLPVIFIGNMLTGLAGTKELSLPMFTVLRRFSILMTMIAELFVLGIRPSVGVQFSVYIMIFGAIIAASNDLAFNLQGYIFILLNNLFTATNGVFMKKKLEAKELGKYGLVYYNSLFMLPPALLLCFYTGDIKLAYEYQSWGDVLFMLQKRLLSTVTIIRPLCTTTHENIPFNAFEDDRKKHYIPINNFQRAVLSAGSALVSLFNPQRGDMIACLGELTGESAAKYMLNKMESSPEGMQILKNRPRINSKTVDLEKLKTYPEGTLGKVYSNFLDNNKVTPDSRPMVQFVEDVNIAYAIQRYREVHDLIHTTLQMPTHMLGEVTVKWVEAIQTRLPMCIGGAVLGATRLKPKHRNLYRKYYLPWAIKTGMNCDFLVNIYFEKRWDQPLIELHKELQIQSFNSS
ncbi:hypothetical protein FQA39_LY12477 [Lamprigera yunnana]|nr:hypothetical protein FQA39_LY12477 [Lamprigera yunnana]